MVAPGDAVLERVLQDVVGVEEAKELSARILAGAAEILFCQRILPSAVSTQTRLRCLPSLLDVWRKSCLPQTTGLELPTPGNARTAAITCLRMPSTCVLAG